MVTLSGFDCTVDYLASEFRQIQNFEIQFNYKMEMLKKIMINYSDNWYQKKPIYLICFILKLQEQTFDFCENFLGGTD